MAIRVVDAGSVLRTATSLKVQDGGTLRRILRVKAMDATSTLRTVATFVPPLTATVTTDGGSTVPIGIGGNLYQIIYWAYATPAGGLGPYTYSWAAISGGGGWSITDATSASSAFSTTTAIYAPAVFRVTVTDAIGQTATADINL